MITIQNYYQTYKAVDGKIFKTKEECISHENSLGRSKCYILTKNINESALEDFGTYVIGYEDGYVTTEYCSGGFLREAGYEDTYHYDYKTLETVTGSYYKVIDRACQNDFWWNRDSKFIKKLNVVAL